MDNAEGWIGSVNLGNPHEFTILELDEKVIRLTGSRSRIFHKPLPSVDPTQRRPNIDTIDYMRNLIAQPPALFAADFQPGRRT